MCWLEIIQSMVTLSYVCSVRSTETWHYVMSRLSSTTRTPTKKETNKQLAYQSQIIVSNLQMTVVLASVLLFGFFGGYYQATMDPEGHKSSYEQFTLFQREVYAGTYAGYWVGFLTSGCLEILRQQEVKFKR